MSDDWFALFVIAAACALTAILTASVMEGDTRRRALENNCGQYNAKTGAFEWARQQPLPTGKPDES
jgi:hypothetical protein